MQLQELAQQLKSVKDEYEAELMQNEKDIRELQEVYDNRLRIENSKITGLIKQREYLIAESNRLENLQFVRFQKLKVIKRNLDAVIGSNL